MDSYNGVVKAVQNYKAQNVKVGWVQEGTWPCRALPLLERGY